MATPNVYYRAVCELTADLVGAIKAVGEDEFSGKAVKRGLVSKNQLKTKRSSHHAKEGQKGASLVVAAIADSVKNDSEERKVFLGFVELLDEAPTLKYLANELRKRAGMRLPGVQQRPPSELPNLDAVEGSDDYLDSDSQELLSGSNDSDHSISSAKNQSSKGQVASMDLPVTDSSKYLKLFNHPSEGVVAMERPPVGQAEPYAEATDSPPGVMVGHVPVSSNRPSQPQGNSSAVQDESHVEDLIRHNSDLQRHNCDLQRQYSELQSAREVESHRAQGHISKLEADLKKSKDDQEKWECRVAEKEKEIETVKRERDCKIETYREQLKKSEKEAKRRSQELNLQLELSRDDLKACQDEISLLEQKNDELAKEAASKEKDYNAKLDNLSRKLDYFQEKRLEAEKKVVRIETALEYERKLATTKHDSEIAQLKSKHDAELSMERERQRLKSESECLLQEKDQEIERLRQYNRCPCCSIF